MPIQVMHLHFPVSKDIRRLASLTRSARFELEPVLMLGFGLGLDLELFPALVVGLGLERTREPLSYRAFIEIAGRTLWV